ncbi:MAG: hypothetical protein CMP48_20950 [Rickettsiales bacterium]|nr:hypothetical protein [Rickettsiales bacterium]
MKAQIRSKFEIEILIDTFYEKVLEHEELSRFFSSAVLNWDFHKKIFVSYWSKQILFTDTYEGSPLHRHIDVDQKFERGFTKHHFDEWARRWVETIDILFEGEKADLAKESGVNMAKNIYLKMFFNRKPKTLSI